jgi:hypothetical protein
VKIVVVGGSWLIGSQTLHHSRSSHAQRLA